VILKATRSTESVPVPEQEMAVRTCLTLMGEANVRSSTTGFDEDAYINVAHYFSMTGDMPSALTALGLARQALLSDDNPQREQLLQFIDSRIAAGEKRLRH
jgi:hypothetical protein